MASWQGHWEERAANLAYIAESRTLLPLAVEEIARARRENDHWKQISKDYPMLLERAEAENAALRLDKEQLQLATAEIARLRAENITVIEDGYREDSYRERTEAELAALRADKERLHNGIRTMVSGWKVGAVTGDAAMAIVGGLIEPLTEHDIEIAKELATRWSQSHDKTKGA
jgi:hypothetical protein